MVGMHSGLVNNMVKMKEKIVMIFLIIGILVGILWIIYFGQCPLQELSLLILLWGVFMIIIAIAVALTNTNRRQNRHLHGAEKASKLRSKMATKIKALLEEIESHIYQKRKPLDEEGITDLALSAVEELLEYWEEKIYPRCYQLDEGKHKIFLRTCLIPLFEEEIKRQNAWYTPTAEMQIIRKNAFFSPTEVMHSIYPYGFVEEVLNHFGFQEQKGWRRHYYTKAVKEWLVEDFSFTMGLSFIIMLCGAIMGLILGVLYGWFIVLNS